MSGRLSVSINRCLFPTRCFPSYETEETKGKMKLFLTALWLVITLTYCDEFQEFIEGDEQLMMLAWDSVTSYFEPIVLMQAVNPEDMAMYDSMTEEGIDAELWHLHDQLEFVYRTLANFAKVAASLTTNNLLEIAEKLTNNQEDFDRMIGEPNQKVISKLFDFRTLGHDKISDGEHSLEFLKYPKYLNYSLFEGLSVYNEDEAGSKLDYWDPETDYAKIAKLLQSDPEHIDSIDKMSIISIAKRVIKKVKKIIQETRKETVAVVKMIKLKKLVKDTRFVSCIKIIMLMEKIKHMIKLIITLIRKLVIQTIKELPRDILWKIKVSMKLILRIFTDIVWELEILIFEISVKISKLMKKMHRVPMEIVVYFKLALLEKLRLEQEDDDNQSRNWKSLDYWLKVWPDTEDIGDMKATFESQVLEDRGPDIEYLESNQVIFPDEFYEIFGSALTQEEIDQVIKDDEAFNFDVVFPTLTKRGLINVFMSEPVEEYEARDLIMRRNENVVFNLETNGTITKVMNSVTSLAHTLKLDLTTLFAAGITIVLYTALVLI